MIPLNVETRFGAHMPTAGGLHNAIYAGQAVGCSVVQIFTKSPQQWKAKEITDEQVEHFVRAQDETGVTCLASHDSYLINPCGPDEELLQKSREALRDEMLRSSRLGIPFVVMHQGALMGCPEEDATARLAESVKFVLGEAPDGGSTLLLETTAGQGTCFGFRFEQIARVMEAVGPMERLGVCLDTCHIFAAGYDLRTEDGYEAVMEEFDRLIGLDRVRLIHGNDSRKGLGSRVDRHAHIGQGEIGAEAFRLLLTDRRLAAVPVTLETPKEGDMDPVNLAALREAAGLPGPACDGLVAR